MLSNIIFSTMLFILSVFYFNSFENSRCAKGVGKISPRRNLLGDVQTTKRSSALLLTLTFRSSAVVSSNCWPSLKEMVVFLNVLSVLMVTMSPFILMITSGLARPPSFRVAKPTPRNQKQNNHYILEARNSVSFNDSSVEE